MGRRPDGALEHEIMRVLWQARRPLQPSAVQSRLGGDLAYTSVATVLGRLHAKGLVSRKEAGRAFAYEAAIAEAEWAARRIGDVLSTASDRAAVLAGFVGTLSKREARALRALLDEAGR